jgi:autotransporter-associated beta strand protein
VTADDATTFTNPIDLYDAARTIYVEDNISTSADYAVISGVISSTTATSGSFVKTGAGVLVLTADNTYAGATTISAGTLALSGSGQIATSSSIVNNATFQIVDGTHTINAITGTGTTEVNGTSVLTAPSITQGTLIIGSGGAAAPVPEPSTLVLLVLASLVSVSAYLRRK